MIPLPSRKALVALLIVVATATFAQSASSGSDGSRRTLVSPAASAKSDAPSAIETAYARYNNDLTQFGYQAFWGPIPASLPRGRTPEPYTLGPGDQLTLLLWGDPVDLGELNSQYTTKVDNDGTFFYPPVGLLRADGLQRAEAEKSIILGLNKKYKRFELRLQVNPQRVFGLSVSGLVAQPGTVLVDPWTSLPEVIMQSGGILKNGTLRNIKLVKADGREVTIDLYDLLIGAKKPMVKLEEGDVLWVGPIGKTAAVYGDVKAPGIFELKSTNTLSDLMNYAGGPLVSTVGAPLTRTSWNGEVWEQSSMAWQPGQDAQPLQDGDVYSIRGVPAQKMSDEHPGFVQVGGEVGAPGFVAWKPGLTLAQALAQAGGSLPTAYLPGMTLTRESVRLTQRQQAKQSLAANKTQIAAVQSKLNQASDAVVLAALGQELTARTQASSLLQEALGNGTLGRLQIDDPTGEKILLQPGDSVIVPPRDGVVYLFGDVYNPGAQIWKPGMTVRAAIDAVGGVTPSGNWDGVYLIRSSGKVESVTARGNFWGMSSLWGEVLQPGDMIYVPIKSSDGSQSWALTKDIISLVAQSTTTLTNVLVLLRTLGAL